jgi:hypothetical protein
MNRLPSDRLPMLALLGLLAALAGTAAYFVVGMSHTTYLVSDGVHLTVHYLDKPRYDMHLQGLIFAVSVLIAGALLLLMALLPDREGRAASAEAAPQPRRRPEPGAQAAPAAAAPQPAAQAAPAAAPQAQAAAGVSTSPLSIEGGEGEAPPPEPAAQPQRPGVSVEEEVLQSAAQADDLPTLDVGDSRFEDTGDEDVVYGSGRVTEDAVWEFVQQYPDSSVKFLYRKTLDNKPLSPTEEDIYRVWEMRGMSRAKVREIVLEVMRWQSLPDNFPHEIWRALRDRIFEIKTR